MKLKSLFLFALVSLIAVAQLRADGGTFMFLGNSLAITAASGTPVVVTTSANGLTAGDEVEISGLTGLAINGIWTCSAVSATTCTLSGSSGNGFFVAAAGTPTLRTLGRVSTGSSPWFDCTRCAKSSVHIYSAAGATTSTVTLEATTRPSTLPTTPPSILATVTNVDNGSCSGGPTDPACGYIAPSLAADFLRVTIGANASGKVIYAILSCTDAGGGRVW